jgi:hypothetical protein
MINSLNPAVKQEHKWASYKCENGSYNGEVDAFWSEGGYWQQTPNGKGTYKSNDGWVYEGEFVKGDRHGYGKFTYKDGRVFEGYWEHNKFADKKKPKE